MWRRRSVGRRNVSRQNVVSPKRGVAKMWIAEMWVAEVWVAKMGSPKRGAPIHIKIVLKINRLNNSAFIFTLKLVILIWNSITNGQKKLQLRKTFCESSWKNSENYGRKVRNLRNESTRLLTKPWNANYLWMELHINDKVINS